MASETGFKQHFNFRKITPSHRTKSLLWCWVRVISISEFYVSTDGRCIRAHFANQGNEMAMKTSSDKFLTPGNRMFEPYCMPADLHV